MTMTGCIYQYLAVRVLALVNPAEFATLVRWFWTPTGFCSVYAENFKSLRQTKGLYSLHARVASDGSVRRKAWQTSVVPRSEIWTHAHEVGDLHRSTMRERPTFVYETVYIRACADFWQLSFMVITVSLSPNAVGRISWFNMSTACVEYQLVGCDTNSLFLRIKWFLQITLNLPWWKYMMYPKKSHCSVAMLKYTVYTQSKCLRWYEFPFFPLITATG